MDSFDNITRVEKNAPDKQMLEFIDNCMRYSLRRSYNPITRKRKDTPNANEYALIYCFFDTIYHALNGPK